MKLENYHDLEVEVFLMHNLKIQNMKGKLINWALKHVAL